MSKTPNLLNDYPRKLVFLGEDGQGPESIRSALELAPDGDYELVVFSSLAKVKDVDLPTYCHAVILDVRCREDYIPEAIEWVGELQCPVALLCLCDDYSQILAYQDRLRWVDDVLLAGSLQQDELPVRLTRAIQHRRMDRERRQDQELLSTLLENVPDSIYFKDRDCCFIRVNAAKASKHNASPDQMVGKTDLDYFTEERARPAFEEEQKIMRTGKPVLGEIQKLTFDDGSVGWVNTSKLPLHDKSGRIIGTMGISRDVTEQVENEQKLEEAKRKLDEGK
jgi:PAS domain S-box-containing protein